MADNVMTGKWKVCPSHPWEILTEDGLPFLAAGHETMARKIVEAHNKTLETPERETSCMTCGQPGEMGVEHIKSGAFVCKTCLFRMKAGYSATEVGNASKNSYQIGRENGREEILKIMDALGFGGRQAVYVLEQTREFAFEEAARICEIDSQSQEPNTPALAEKIRQAKVNPRSIIVGEAELKELESTPSFWHWFDKTQLNKDQFTWVAAGWAGALNSVRRKLRGDA